MHRPPKISLALAIAILPGPASAAITQYAGSVQFDPATRIVKANIRLTLNQPGNSTKLYLNKDFKIESLQCPGCDGFSQQQENAGEYRNASLAALRLHALEQTLGSDKFLKFLRTLFEKNVKTTQGLLAELQREDGETISKQFEQSLHQ